ncbi:unnamed protein product [Pleuronectes platessa]|uniref:Uncharacterized protein n=1 Tax=Pleuronectes platessa TaxID=8262 RepID=A0A9N7VM47_PLEPL|nr:unnamed protein product [Pleuronectes platessa]
MRKLIQIKRITTPSAYHLPLHRGAAMETGSERQASKMADSFEVCRGFRPGPRRVDSKAPDWSHGAVTAVHVALLCLPPRCEGSAVSGDSGTSLRQPQPQKSQNVEPRRPQREAGRTIAAGYLQIITVEPQEHLMSRPSVSSLDFLPRSAFRAPMGRGSSALVPSPLTLLCNPPPPVSSLGPGRFTPLVMLGPAVSPPGAQARPGVAAGSVRPRTAFTARPGGTRGNSPTPPSASGGPNTPRFNDYKSKLACYLSSMLRRLDASKAYTDNHNQNISPHRFPRAAWLQSRHAVRRGAPRFKETHTRRRATAG